MDEHDLNRLFLRGIWASAIPGDDDPSWVERVAAQPITGDPLGDFGFCSHLADPVASYETFDDDPGEIEWGLFELDVNTGEPIRPLLGLHEDILGLDPSGNEMRPSTHQP